MLSAAKIALIAAACHGANREWCLAHGDTSQSEWKDAPEWQKQSAIKGVEFHIANPEAGPSGSHDSWMEEKLAAGWVYGEIKDPEKKTHPCIVAHDELPAAQRAKDVIFTAICRDLVDFLEEEGDDEEEDGDDTSDEGTAEGDTDSDEG